MRNTPFVIGSILVIALSASASAVGCQMTTSPATVMTASGSAGVTVGSGEAFSLTFYLVNDACQLDGSCLASTWVYREMNGVDGLQRHDDYRDDTCGGRYPADLLVL